MNDIAEGEAMPLPENSDATVKRPRSKKVHSAAIRRCVREALLDVMTGEQTNEKTRIDAAKVLIDMVGKRRRIRLRPLWPAKPAG